MYLESLKYQGVKEFHMLARIGCCNFMVFSPFKVNVSLSSSKSMVARGNQW